MNVLRIQISIQSVYLTQSQTYDDYEHDDYDRGSGVNRTRRIDHNGADHDKHDDKYDHHDDYRAVTETDNHDDYDDYDAAD